MKSLNLIYFIICVSGQSYEDERCRCICPVPTISDVTRIENRVFNAYIPPALCNCPTVIKTTGTMKDIENTELFCKRCICSYNTRNTGLIKVVILSLLWVIVILCLYMGFKWSLTVFAKRKRKIIYQHGEEAHSLLLSEDRED